MRTVKNLWPEITTLDNLYQGYLAGRKGKRNTRAVLEFEADLGANLSALQKELVHGTYTPGDYRTFYVHEPKKRLIHAPMFRDVVVQQAIYRRIYPIFDRRFIHDSYGCRVKKGTHRAADRAQHFLQQTPELYTLQLDIRKYYASINSDVLKKTIERVIVDPQLLQVLYLFIDNGRGVPIGNLLSQLFGLVYLDVMDQYIKRALKVKYYVRYVDDFILFGLTYSEARELLNTLADWLQKELHLELSKWRIARTDHGVNFVGYRTWAHKRLVRKYSLHRYGRALRAGKLESLMAMLGHAAKTNSYRNHLRRMIDEVPELYSQINYAHAL